MRRIYRYIFTTLFIILCQGCIEEDNFSNSPAGNFDALWTIIDQRYCFFEHAEEEFGLNWQEVYRKYRPLAEQCKNNIELFDTLGNMLKELRDGHVNLVSSYGTSYYWDWKLDHAINFSDSIQRNYLGNDFGYSNGIKFCSLMPDSIGYAHVSTFADALSDNNISIILTRLAKNKGLILDIRNNGGGMLTSAETLASHFTNEKIHTGYIQHKTGTGHNDFSSPEAIYLERGDGTVWLRPVVVLTNRAVYSSANHFVMLMRELPHVIILGDKTGGGSGLPLNSSLPNGWTVRFSACPILDKEGRHTEFGIEPDLTVNITSEDWNRGKDTMIEVARELINLFCYKKNEEEAE